MTIVSPRNISVRYRKNISYTCICVAEVLCFVFCLYDRINIAVPKGQKDIIKARAEAKGQSINAYINAAIDEKLKQDQ